MRAAACALAAVAVWSANASAGGAVLEHLGVVGLTGTIGLQYLAFAAVGFAGVLLLLGERGDGGGGAPALGFAAAGGSALAMAAYTVGAGRVQAPTTDLLLAGTGAGTALMVPAAILDGGAWSPTWAVALAAGIGVLMLAVGYGLWTVAMAAPNGGRLAPLGYATPLLSTLLLLATGSSIGPMGIAGCGLIVACTLGVAAQPAIARCTSSAARSTSAATSARDWRQRPST